jgi:hypothetical protein
MKIQTYLILLFLSISFSYAQNCGNFTQFLTINPQDGAIPQCTPVNCTLNLCNYTPNNIDVLVFIRFDLSFEFFNSNDFVLDNDPNNPTQVRLRLLTTSLQSGCTDFNFQIRSVGGTGHINGEIQFPNSGCPNIAIPSRFMVPQSISVVGTDGVTTNISASFPGIPDRILVRGTVVLNQGTNGNAYEVTGLPTFPAFIALDRNARIVVPNGMDLVVRNADIHGFINKWESIVVENGARLLIQETNVEDGRKAIVARDGAFIILRRNNFTDNVISYYTDYSSQTQNVNTRIRGCNFRGTGQLKPDNGMVPDNEIPTSGIEVHHTIGLDIGELAGNAGLIPCRFENLSDGIDAFHSVVFVIGARFENITPTLNASGIGILSNGIGSSLYFDGNTNNQGTNFRNCAVGISSGNALELFIERAVMEDVHDIGINIGLVSPNNFIFINENRIFGSKLGIRSLWNSIGRLGQMIDNTIIPYPNDGDVSNSYAIRAHELTYSGNWQLRMNKLFAQSGRGAISYYRGNNAVIAENSLIGGDLFDSQAALFGGTANSTIRCNQIQGSQSGLTSGLYLSTGGNNMISCNNIEGVSRGFNFLGMSDNTDFKGNQINSTNFGLQIQESSYIGVQDHRGNLFNGPFFNPNGDGAIHLSNDPVIVSYSEFKVDPNFNPLFCPFPSGCGGNWFIPETNSNPFQCNTNTPFGTCPLGIGVGFQAPNEGGLNARLMSGNTRDFSNSNILWTGQKQLYESLVNNRDLLANSRGFSSFVREQSQKSIGKYFAIQNNVRELAKRTHEMTNDVGVKAEENRKIVKEVNTIFDKYIETNDKTEKKQLERQIKLLNQKIAVNHTYNLAKLAEVETAKNRDIDQLIGENDRLEARIQVERNTKAVNRIMLEAFKSREAKLTEEQIRILEPIANQCPIDGGEAVYEARSLLGAVENRYYDDARLCPEINGLNANSNSGTQALKTAVTKAKLLTFNASPNPAKDVLDVVVNTTIGENTEGTLKIINALGAVVLSQKVANNSQNHIDISILKSGIYLIRLEVGGNSQIQKITILK